jgi:LmbE family N-acetylglucosaminyl deacetylase
VRVFERAAALTPGYQHIYVEPHFDDVALSCGGTVCDQVSRGEPVLVVTLFAGHPGDAEPATDFVREHHAKWRSGADPIGERVEEQRRALELLGADWLPLGFLDAIYRGDQYHDDAELFGPILPGDRDLASALAAALGQVEASQATARWYVPLAVGNHVDHQLALAGSTRLPNRRAYEDFPYAAQRGGVDERAAALGATTSLTVPTERWLARKCDAVACYRSQVPVLFGDDAAMRLAVEEYARVRQGERLWLLPSGAGAGC